MTSAFARILPLLFTLLLGLAVAQNGPHWNEELGEEVYENQCASCHQSSGEGVEGQFPALRDNDFVTGDPEPVIDIVLHGRGAMPAFANLEDEEIAAVVSYIRNAWDNEVDAVTEDEVAERRNAEDENGNDENENAENGNDDNDTADAELPEGWREEGETLFVNQCAACHQADGEGIEGVFPNLAGNPLVTSEQDEVVWQLIDVVLYGRGGMPAFAGSLSDEEIAFVLSFVRKAWENDASPIHPETVARVRAGEDLERDEEDDEEEDEKDPQDRPGAAD